MWCGIQLICNILLHLLRTILCENKPGYAPMTESEMLAKLEKSREQGMFRDAEILVSEWQDYKNKMN